MSYENKLNTNYDTFNPFGINLQVKELPLLLPVLITYKYEESETLQSMMGESLLELSLCYVSSTFSFIIATPHKYPMRYV